MATQDISSRFSLPIEAASINKVEPFVRHWSEASNVKEESQFRLVYAVNEMTEGIIRLGTELLITGIIEFGIVPCSGSIEISITFPGEIPLDPAFNHNDGILEQFPGMTLSPDIFWHHIILYWIDKAWWTKKGKKITITLTQYARDPNKAGELYFLSIRPRLPESIKISYGNNDFVIVQYKDQESAIRLIEKAAFVLKAVDGHTPVREIYYSFIGKYGIVHPLSFGKLVEDLIAKKLILTGDPIISDEPGWLRKTARKYLKMRYSFPEPDRIITAINRRAGWIWCKQALIIYVAFLLIGFLYFALNYRELSFAFHSAFNKGLHIQIWYLFIFYCLYSLGIVLHELAHGIVCKRFGGTVHEMGLLVYFGNICPYVDTTDTWMFPSKMQRISVSFAGPLATLVFACFNGILSFLFPNDHSLSVVFGSLFVMNILSFIINLIPWGETDGYYIISDLFSIPNLRIKAFRYLFSRIKNLFSKSHNADLPLREKVIYLIYAVLTPIVAVSLLLIPAIVFLEDKLRRLPVSLSIFLLFLFLTIFFERVIKKAVHWYVRSRITTINLKK